MKKSLFPCSLLVCLLLTVASNRAMAQEDEPATIHITVKEGGKVTTDTTFTLKEGQDPELIEKLVSHLTGGDAKTGQKEVIIIQKGDDELLEWTEDDDDLNVYVIKKGDKEVKVVKKVTVQVEDESGKEMEKEVEVEVKKEKRKKEQ